jgi:hypothetical protein
MSETTALWLSEVAPYPKRRAEADYPEQIKRMLELAFDAEREEIACLVEAMGAEGYGAQAIAAAIRARSDA